MDNCFPAGEMKAELVDISPVMIVLMDLNQNLLWANKTFLQSSGMSLEQLEGRKCYEVWGGDSFCAGCSVAETIRTGDDHEAIVFASGKNKTPYDAESWMIKSSALKGKDGVPQGVVATIFEITGLAAQVERYERTMASLMKLLKASVDHSSSELLRMFLDEAEYLTDSTIGFYHFVEDDQATLSLQMWSTQTLRSCSSPGAGTHYLIEQAGVWVDCVREGEPVIHNDYASLPHRKGLPEGHVPVIRELVVQVVRGKTLLAILGVANKPKDYDANDV